jgi:hypothetical protein
MSSCAASCSICCRRGSCASATSVSSPTGAEPHCCRSASNCSADQSRAPLQQHSRLPKRLIRSGTVQSAAELCVLLKASLPPNSCTALHLNHTSAPHEPLSTTSAPVRALARMRIPCLNSPKLLRYRSLQSPNDPSCRRSPVRLGHQGGRTYKLQRIHQLNEDARTHSKYIGSPCGRLPSSRCIRSDLPKRVRTRTVARGRSRYSTRTCRDQDGHSRVAGRSSRVPKCEGPERRPSVTRFTSVELGHRAPRLTVAQLLSRQPWDSSPPRD